MGDTGLAAEIVLLWDCERENWLELVRSIIYICLKERKGMLGKGRKKEKSCLWSRGLLAPSQQSSELGITVSILQRRNQASKQLSKLTKATKLVSEELRIKATD